MAGLNFNGNAPKPNGLRPDIRASPSSPQHLQSYHCRPSCCFVTDHKLTVHHEQRIGNLPSRGANTRPPKYWLVCLNNNIRCLLVVNVESERHFVPVGNYTRCCVCGRHPVLAVESNESNPGRFHREKSADRLIPRVVCACLSCRLLATLLGKHLSPLLLVVCQMKCTMRYR